MCTRETCDAMIAAIDEIQRVIVDATLQPSLEAMRERIASRVYDSTDDFTRDVESILKDVPNYFFVPVILRDFTSKVKVLEKKRILASLSGTARVDFITGLFHSSNFNDPSSVRDLATILRDTHSILRDLTIAQRSDLINLVDKMRTSLPAELTFVATAVSRDTPHLEFVSPTNTLEIPPAAISEIISLVSKFPSGTPLIPYDWRERFGISFEEVVLARPDLFAVTRKNGLLWVRLLSSSQPVVHASVQTLNFQVEPDPQYILLSKLSLEGRVEVVGAAVLEKANEKIKQLCRQNPAGCFTSRVQRALLDSGFGPLPLQWFSDQLFIFDGLVRLRRVPKVVADPADDAACARVISLVEKSGGRAKLVNLERSLKIENLQELLKRIPGIFYEPDRVFPLPWIEECIFGFEISAPEAPPSAFRLLCDSILTELGKIEKIPAKHVLRWCRALNVAPRLLCQALRKEIFWSVPESDLEIVSLRQPKKIPQAIPLAPLTAIRNSLKGGATTVDRIMKEAAWGKNSENRREYGSLRLVLDKVGEVFYEPSYVYSRLKIDHLLVLPEWDETKPSKFEEIEALWVAKQELHALLTGYLVDPTICPLRKYPLDQVKIYCSQRDIPEGDLLVLYDLFIPMKIVYLRSGVVIKESWPDEARSVYQVLSSLPFNACDCDALLKGLVDCSRFTLEVTDSMRFQLPLLASLQPRSDSWFTEMCFYDPDHIYLVSDADDCLAGAPFNRRGLPEERLPELDSTPDAQLLALLD